MSHVSSWFDLFNKHSSTLPRHALPSTCWSEWTAAPLVSSIVRKEAESWQTATVFWMLLLEFPMAGVTVHLDTMYPLIKLHLFFFFLV